jgi:hypothetical protein
MPMAERRTPDGVYGMLGGTGRMRKTACRRAGSAVMTGPRSFDTRRGERSKKTRSPDS